MMTLVSSLHRKQQEYQDLLKQQIEEKQRKKDQVRADCGY
jgi:hypothetical protein